MIQGMSQFRQEFHRRLWEQDLPGLKGLLVKSCRVLVLAFRGLQQHRSWFQASTLAYATILALIPLMALLFAILKSLGIQRILASHIMERLAPGSHEFAAQIFSYIEGTQVTSLGVFGVVWLLAALVILMSTVEQAFNETWQVAQTRSWRRKLSDYLSIFLIFPIFMAVAISLSGGIMSQPDIRAFLVGILPEFLYSATSGLLSLGLLWVAFTFFYQVMPNTKVHFLSALLGGILGGSLWQMAHYLFAWFQGAATYYNAIYGALYHLLFLVIWMFWSWLIVLLGTEVVFAHQNLEELSRECRRPAPAPEPVDEYLAFAGLIAICQPYVRREALLTLADLQRLLVTADTLAARTLQALLECGLVLEVAEAAAPDLHRLVPALPPDQVTVKETLDCLRQKRYAALTQTLAPDPRLENLWQHLLQRLSPSPWDVMTLTELIKALDQEDWPEAIERQAIERQAIGNKQ